MASPRRSNRGGHARSKKKEEDDDGGTTRCVCNEQHHEGVMIQCETCKVWQHCPCVGLGEGEVTPDKYYCETCRPQNHPYKVVNGVLITNAANPKRGHAAPAVPPPSLKAKTAKKRNTMNSKEASTPMDFILAQQKWSEGDPLDGIESNSHSNRASKRRRKTDSTTDDDDDAKADDCSPNGGLKSESDDPQGNNQHHHGSSSSSPSTSPKATSNGHFKNTQSPKHKKSSNSNHSHTNSKTTQSRSSSPTTPNGSTHPDSHSNPDVKADGSMSPNAGSKNVRPSSDAAATQDADGIVPLTKRRKTKPDASGRGDSAAAEDAMSDAASEKVKRESNGDLTDVPTTSRSRKNGFSRTGSNRRIQIGSDAEDNDDSSSPTDSQAGQAGSPGSSSTATGNGRRSGAGHSIQGGKKSTRRTTEPRSSARHNGNNSRHSTPQPHDRSGTPQPWPPVTPAVVRYPSPKMTIQEMTRRAKQLLDYITRMQVDMANEKNRSGCSTPASTPPKNGHLSSCSTSSTISTLVPSVTAPVQHPVHHHPGDSQVPDLTRTSMESTTDCHMSDTEVKSGNEMKSENHDGSGVLAGGGAFVEFQDPIVAPSLLSSADDIPALDSTLSADGTSSLANSLASVKVEDGAREKWTSFELMDKLTGDLIRFQEKFGVHA